MWNKEVKKRMKESFLIATVVAAGSQVNINLILNDFKISLAIIIIPLVMYIFRDMDLITTTLMSAFSVYFWRVGIFFLKHGDFQSAFTNYFPEIFFYLYYGLFLKIYLVYNKNFKSKYMLLHFIAIDYFANLMEMVVRLDGHIFNFTLEGGIILVAIIRSLIIWALVNGLDYYSILLLKNEHEERYKKLLCLTSKLKSEMFWMEKNMHHIEKTMTTAYSLFEKIEKAEDEEEWGTSALTIAKDIHEIKKEYGLVVRGLKEVVDEKFYDEGMYFKDLIKVLKQSMEREINNIYPRVKIIFTCNNDFFTKDHYYLMSIFRNVIFNAVEAIAKENDKTKSYDIHFISYVHNKNYCFEIRDNGPGIKDEYLKMIFSPGFSTKINYETGEINRGLGLSLVKEIVTDILKGSIEVESKVGKGTTFIIQFPGYTLEE